MAQARRRHRRSSRAVYRGVWPTLLPRRLSRPQPSSHRSSGSTPEPTTRAALGTRPDTRDTGLTSGRHGPAARPAGSRSAMLPGRAVQRRVRGPHRFRPLRRSTSRGITAGSGHRRLTRRRPSTTRALRDRGGQPQAVPDRQAESRGDRGRADASPRAGAARPDHAACGVARPAGVRRDGRKRHPRARAA